MSLAPVKALLINHFPAIYGWLCDRRDRVAPQYGEPELRLLPWLVPSDRAAIDVGANTGMYSYWLLRHAANVIAVEPNHQLCRILSSRFTQAMRAGRFRLEAVALGAEDGSAELVVPPGREALGSIDAPGSGHEAIAGERQIVPVRRLDSLTFPPIGFIKIDAEGFEVPAIQGGLGLIARDRPGLLIEAEERHRHGAIGELRALLEPLGYTGWYQHQGELQPIAAFDIARLQSRDALNEAGTHRLPGATYINNFMFVPDDAALTRLRSGIGR